MRLPSGQAVAEAMGIRDKNISDDPELPLWYYILKEAEEQQKLRDIEAKQEANKQQKNKETTQTKGQLGPVGSRIVAEVIIGLLVGDPHSFLNIDPWWYPNCFQESPVMLKDPENPFILKDCKNPFTLKDILQITDTPPTNSISCNRNRKD